MTKQWTEVQAWRHLAACWRKAEYYPSAKAAFAKVGYTKWQSIGLCNSVDQLKYQGLIGWETASKMSSLIGVRVSRSRWAPWGWPHTTQGARWRAAFCARQAENAAAREKRRKKA